ncbi:hypothetical protein [Mobilicoccus pelagius]|uniref:Lipoprotein n=1 Tax=Mobilicoccus pelagius NBRC 104925 TaxID=1089455 RepID=H5UND9_9MICO|nr:hypothetical protein [Mobilicoccus pelagius]GAB47247.1 hypothetical protein MOPEL_007_00630 [Mobilicoccus pelagius NBRC 104925]
MIRTRFAAVLAALPLALAGCSGAQTPADTAASAPSSSQAASASPTAGQEVDTATFFSDSAKAITAAKTYTMTMLMENGGQKVTMTGSGDVSDQNRPKADMTMSADGGGQQTRMIVDGDSVYMQMPGVAEGGKFVKMPLQALSQAGGQDLTKMMNPAENLRMTQNAVEKVVYAGPDSGLQKYTVTMNPQKLQQSLPTAAPSPSGMPSSLPYDVWLDDAHLVLKMVMTMDGTTMTMTADEYGEPVSIVTPPQESVTQMPGMSTSEPGTVAPAPAPTATPAPAPTTTK